MISIIKPAGIDDSMAKTGSFGTHSTFEPYLAISLCREGIEYNLGDRGLRVVSGRNADDSGADSNGTGKSSLVMAALWCLTGRSDARTMASSFTGHPAGLI